LQPGQVEVETPAAEEPPPAAEPQESPVARWVASAETLIEQEQYLSAFEILNVAVEMDPDLDDAYFHRGVALHLLGRLEDAIADFEMAISATSRPVVTYTCLYNQACGHALLGNVEEAVDLLEKSYASGYQDIDMQMMTDPDLNSLRENERFREFLLLLRTP